MTLLDQLECLRVLNNRLLVLALLARVARDRRFRA